MPIEGINCKCGNKPSIYHLTTTTHLQYQSRLAKETKPHPKDTDKEIYNCECGKVLEVEKGRMNISIKDHQVSERHIKWAYNDLIERDIKNRYMKEYEEKIKNLDSKYETKYKEKEKALEEKAVKLELDREELNKNREELSKNIKINNENKIKIRERVESQNNLLKNIDDKTTELNNREADLIKREEALKNAIVPVKTYKTIATQSEVVETAIVPVPKAPTITLSTEHKKYFPLFDKLFGKEPVRFIPPTSQYYGEFGLIRAFFKHSYNKMALEITRDYHTDHLILIFAISYPSTFKNADRYEVIHKYFIIFNRNEKPVKITSKAGNQTPYSLLHYHEEDWD